MSASYNRLSDIVATLTVFSAGDTGTFSGSGGSPITLNFDTITITESEDTVDASGGQDLWPTTRTTKRTWSAEIETKFGAGFARPALGAQATLTLTGIIGNKVYSGRITAVNPTLTSDSTIRITLSPYGIGPAAS